MQTQSYASDLTAVGGIEWSKAESSYFHAEPYRPRIYTIPDLVPGYMAPPFPRSLPEVGIATAARRRQLIVDYDGAIASGQWTRALRCAIIAELVRRTTRIQTARGGTYAEELRLSGGLYASETALPPPPPELRPVFHGLAYGHRPIDIALMGAIGVRPIEGALAGFEALDPLYAYVRIRNHVSKRTVSVPSVVGRAWIADDFLPQDPEALARSCRELVIRFDADTSPLCLLELHMLACIPSGQLVLPPGAKGQPRYEHLFGVADDTRHFWLTAYHTDRRQLPCTPILTPSADLFEPAIEPRRLDAMRVLEAHRQAEERAMFQVMLGVWGIDRLIIGRPLVWREEESGSPDDDFRFAPRDALLPQWVPQRQPNRSRALDDDFLSARAPRRTKTLAFDVAPVNSIRSATSACGTTNSCVSNGCLRRIISTRSQCREKAMPSPLIIIIPIILIRQSLRTTTLTKILLN